MNAATLPAMLAISVMLAGCAGEQTSEPVGREHESSRADSDGPPTQHPREPSQTSLQDRSSVRPQFTDVAARSGLSFTYFNDAVPGRFFLPEVMGGGVGWLDFDNDGWLDLLLTNGCAWPDVERTPAEVVSRLFRNRGDGTFEDVSRLAEVARRQFGQGVAVADFNADGFADVYLTNYGPNRLLVNQGDGTFADVTEWSGTGDPSWSTGAAWFDADLDGDEDLYVVNYLELPFEQHRVCHYDGIAGYCGPGSFPAAPDRLYCNQGDGRFVESSVALGMVGENGKGMSVAVLDLDGDLRPEVYVANDMTANFLFARSGTAELNGVRAAIYRDVAVDGGCAVSGAGQVEASMGIAVGDFDGDGNVDLYLTHFYAQKNTLYRNLGRLQFHDDSFRSRVAATSMLFNGFGTVALDVDRDEALDVFIANGHVLGPNLPPYEMTPQLLRNDGRGRFEDISATAGDVFAEPTLGRGVAAADFDNDGDLDLAVANLHHPLALLRNDTETHRHFLGIDLRTRDRTLPVGARVIVTANGRKQVRPFVSGGSYLAASDTRLLFGLRDAAQIEQVEVFWPSGRVDVFTQLAVDRYWRILEGDEPRDASPRSKR
jgi:hypothetical protein